MKTNSPAHSLPDLDPSLLGIKEDDQTSRKFFMLIEGTYGLGVKHSIAKYGYSEQRYYQLLKKFRTEGISGLRNKKRGPKENSVRTEKVNQQIIRYRFLDPEMSPEVITQKLGQTGIKISQRSVSRTIAEFGLQKKTLSTKSR